MNLFFVKYKNKTSTQQFRIRCRFFIILGIVFIIILLTIYKIIPSGHIIYQKNYEQKLRSGKGFIYNFTPSDRVVENKRSASRLIGDPVYFSVFTPRTFSQAKLKIFYKNNLSNDTPIIEAGVLVDPLLWRYDLRPIENKIVDTIFNNTTLTQTQDKHILRENINRQDLILWQRYPDYQTISDFLADFSNHGLSSCTNTYNNCLATYNYSLPVDNWPQASLIPKLVSQIELTQVDNLMSPVPLRGAHILWFYLPQEQNNFFISFNLTSNNNASITKDRLLELLGQAKVILSEGDNLLYEQAIVDLINFSHEKEEYFVQLPNLNLTTGIYKLEIKIHHDLIIKDLFNPAPLKAFLYHLHFDNQKGDLTIFTDQPYLQIKPMGISLDSSINFSGEELLLDKLYLQQEIKLNNKSREQRYDQIEENLQLNSNPYTIKTKVGEFILENNGLFSFSEQNIINPFPQKVDHFFNFDQSVNYIIINYIAPDNRGDLQIAEAEFSLLGKYREKGKYNFMISIPGLRAEEQIADKLNYLEIKKIEIELRGRSLWDKLLNRTDQYK